MLARPPDFQCRRAHSARFLKVLRRFVALSCARLCLSGGGFFYSSIHVLVVMISFFLSQCHAGTLMVINDKEIGKTRASRRMTLPDWKWEFFGWMKTSNQLCCQPMRDLLQSDYHQCHGEGSNFLSSAPINCKWSRDQFFWGLYGNWVKLDPVHFVLYCPFIEKTMLFLMSLKG